MKKKGGRGPVQACEGQSVEEEEVGDRRVRGGAAGAARGRGRPEERVEEVGGLQGSRRE